jgi:High potential iron-sulfur protein
MNDTPRRLFMMRSLAGGCALAMPLISRAAGHVEETDETAVALGYRHDTRQVDQEKYPHHTPQQHCTECAFWQGVATDAWAGCAMFGRRQVAADAWCSAFAKKPA